jgi:hypothetical protein
MLQQLAQRCNDAIDVHVKGVMTRVTSLFALWTMEQNLRWFVSTRCLNSTDVDMIQVRASRVYDNHTAYFNTKCGCFTIIMYCATGGRAQGYLSG